MAKSTGRTLGPFHFHHTRRAADRNGCTVATEAEVRFEHLKALIDEAPEGIFVADEAGRYTYVNRIGCAMLGYSQAELVGMRTTDLIAPEELDDLVASREAARRYGTREVALWHLRRKDGRHLPVEISARRLPDGEWIALFHDVSAKLAAQQALADSEQKFRGLVEAAQDAIVVVDHAGIVQFANRRLLAWFGYRAREVVGQPIELLVPSEGRARHEAARAAYLRTPHARAMGAGPTLRARRKDGSEFPIDIALSPSVTPAGTIVTAVIRDVSAARQAETQMSRLAAASRMLAETLDIDAILDRCADIVVPELADGLVIRLIDDAGLFSTVKAAHCDPQRQRAFEAYAQRAEASAAVQRIFTATASAGGPRVVLRADAGAAGEAAHFTDHDRSHEFHIHSFVIFPLTTRGKLIGAMTFVLERSERDFAPEDIGYFDAIGARMALSIENARLYLDAKRAIAAREEILTFVSHDLKNPLASIHAVIDLLKHADLPAARRLELLALIENSTERMNGLIADLLDFSRLSSGAFSISPTAENVAELLTPLLAQAAILAEEKRLAIRVEIQTELPRVSCDLPRIREVVSNLLDNAVKFTAAGGTITVTTRLGDVGVEFIIADTGRGIAREDLGRIFDRYWRAENTLPGSGLGLSIAKTIIEAHGQTLGVESSPGVGTRFFFSLPAA